MIKLGLGVIFLAAGLLFTQFGKSLFPGKEADNAYFAEKVNIALRRTAHRLLASQGDSTSLILPVQQTDARTFNIRLDHTFIYERVPNLLQESLAQQNIKTEYNVAILNCNDGIIQLGYSYRDLVDSLVACTGREQKAGCRTLQITFDEPKQAGGYAWGAGLLGFLLAGISGLVWYRVAKARDTSETLTIDSDESEDVIRLGNANFYPAEQSLDVAGIRHELTYREAKLLRLFATHPNQLLERDFILKSVWEDEGIFVGRSVDVFVSRLRKLLRDDPTVRIATVHGVGYRLEVAVG